MSLLNMWKALRDQRKAAKPWYSAGGIDGTGRCISPSTSQRGYVHSGRDWHDGRGAIASAPATGAGFIAEQ